MKTVNEPGLLRVTIVESPYGSRVDGSRCTPEEVERNVRYARRAMRDCFERGEVPFASHLLYPGTLDDADAEQRAQGMQAGIDLMRLVISAGADVVQALYVDQGVTPGMRAGFDAFEGVEVELRSIGAEAEIDKESVAKALAHRSDVILKLRIELSQVLDAWLNQSPPDLSVANKVSDFIIRTAGL